MASLPSISVVVPAFNAESLLPETLPPIRAACAAGAGWELVVVDDGSTDGTAEAAAPWADRVVRLPAPAGGPSRARNAGAAAARGEWLLFVDADVRLHPDTLDRLVRSIAEHPGVVAIFGAYDAAPEGRGPCRNVLGRVGSDAPGRLHRRGGVRHRALSPAPDRGHRARLPGSRSRRAHRAGSPHPGAPTSSPGASSP